jgi:hypothetical protein
LRTKTFFLDFTIALFVGKRREKMASVAGRKRGVVAAFVDDVKCAGEATIYTCNRGSCGKKRVTQQWQATVWAEHICLECRGASDEDKLKVFNAHKSEKLQRLFTPRAPAWTSQQGRAGSGAEGENDVVQPLKKQKSSTIKRVDFCDKERADRIMEKITRFIVGCALSFLIIESVFFLDLLASLNTAFMVYLVKSDAFRTTWVPRLFESTVLQVADMWVAMGSPLRTLGFDGFKTEAGTHVVNCTESALDKTAFTSCVDPGERHEDHKFYAEVIIAELEKGASAANKSVEETYAGVVADNVEYNMAAFRLVARDHPRLFYMGCVAHCFDLLNEDMAKIGEFAKLIALCHMMAKFVKGHKYVAAAFKRIIGRTGLTLKLFPLTRFAYASLMILRVLKNKANLEALVEEEQWQQTRKGITASVVETFTDGLDNFPKRQLDSMFRGVFAPLSAATHFVETRGARASFVGPLFDSLAEDVKQWSEKEATILLFETGTIEEASNALSTRWLGLGRLRAALKNPVHTFARIIDPYTTPRIDELPEDYEEQCRLVLNKFYEDDELEEQ